MNGELIERLRGGLIVSCQAYPGEPLRQAGVMAEVARAVQLGGAVAVRLEGVGDVAAGVRALDVPVIGIRKAGASGVVITPTLADARAVATAGAAIVALDGTRRPRPDGLSLARTVAALRASTTALVMADCGSAADADAAVEAGVDLVGTTLAGYTGERPAGDGPDLELVSLLAGRVPVPVIAEGRIRTPDEARAALAAGAHAVCVGTAITHPTALTRRFVAALGG